MSATIKWKLMPETNATLSCSTPSSFIAAMIKAFGNSPWFLDYRSVSTLQGMAAVSDPFHNPYATLVDLILDENTLHQTGSYRAIEVWPEY